MRYILITIVTIAVLSACSPFGANDGVHVITVRFFVTQFHEVMLNADNFIGRTIRYESMFAAWYIPALGETFYMVYRNTEGCCDPVEPVGFELSMNSFRPSRK